MKGKRKVGQEGIFPGGDERRIFFVEGGRGLSRVKSTEVNFTGPVRG